MPLRKAFQIACQVAVIVTAAVYAATPAAAEALLLIEADSGRVLQAENATYPWYPASVTKLMTAYVTLKAVKEGRITLNTPFVVSANALAQAPTKMGFKIGTVVTVDNALKMLLVKSANDMAVLLAEGVGGSIDGFSDQMNAAAQRLGMTQTSYVNPNGLPADGQVTSARDLGILARAIYRELPEYAYFWHLPGIKFGRRVIRNYNKLIDLYPGADGMKTGFICASGFNLVASATRNNRRLIAVVLGAPSASVRMYKAAKMLEQGFSNNRLSWLMPTLGTVDQLKPIDAAPVNLREETCGAHRKRPAAEDEEVEVSGGATGTGDGGSPLSFLLSNMQSTVKMSQVLGQGVASLPPVEVFVGAVKPSTAAAAEAQESQIVGGGKRTKKAKGKSKSKSKTADAPAKPAAEGSAKSSDKTTTKKPAAAKPAAAKPAAKPAASLAPPAVKTAAGPAAATQR
ncbi:MAG: D-alanyl-D-alanine carboxypeptidase family protein [Xanthobacteraceae bacterium]